VEVHEINGPSFFVAPALLDELGDEISFGNLEEALTIAREHIEREFGEEPVRSARRRIGEVQRLVVTRMTPPVCPVP
jgi:hypothetical protein